VGKHSQECNFAGKPPHVLPLPPRDSLLRLAEASSIFRFGTARAGERASIATSRVPCMLEPALAPELQLVLRRRTTTIADGTV
jgi:hypothetical protein